MHVGQPSLDAVVVEAEPLVIQPEQVQDGRVQIVDRRHRVDGAVAELVGRPVAEGAFDAGAESLTTRAEYLRLTAWSGAAGQD